MNLEKQKLLINVTRGSKCQHVHVSVISSVRVEVCV